MKKPVFAATKKTARNDPGGPAIENIKQ